MSVDGCITEGHGGRITSRVMVVVLQWVLKLCHGGRITEAYLMVVLQRVMVVVLLRVMSWWAYYRGSWE